MEGPPGSLPARLLHLAWVFLSLVPRLVILGGGEKGTGCFPTVGTLACLGKNGIWVWLLFQAGNKGPD